jgi:hypothetical protein
LMSWKERNWWKVYRARDTIAARAEIHPHTITIKTAKQWQKAEPNRGLGYKFTMDKVGTPNVSVDGCLSWAISS